MWEYASKWPLCYLQQQKNRERERDSIRLQHFWGSQCGTVGRVFGSCVKGLCMELFSRSRLRLVSVKVVICCLYEFAK